MTFPGISHWTKVTPYFPTDFRHFLKTPAFLWQASDLWKTKKSPNFIFPQNSDLFWRAKKLLCTYSMPAGSWDNFVNFRRICVSLQQSNWTFKINLPRGLYLMGGRTGRAAVSFHSCKSEHGIFYLFLAGLANRDINTPYLTWSFVLMVPF